MRDVFWNGFADEVEKLAVTDSGPALDRAMKDLKSAVGTDPKFDATTRMREEADRYSAEQLSEYDKSEYGKKHPRPKKPKTPGKLGKLMKALRKVK
jgi:hypothetical protein